MMSCKKSEKKENNQKLDKEKEEKHFFHCTNPDSFKFSFNI